MLEYVLAGNTVEKYLITLCIFIGIVAVFKILKEYSMHVLQKLFDRTKNEVDNIIIECIKRIPNLFYIILSVCISLKFLVLPALIDKINNYAILILLVYIAGSILQDVLELILHTQAKKQKNNKGLLQAMGILSKVALWSVALLLILSNMGVNISSLIAGLGVGGIAIAFALQNVLADIFASFSIYFDKPFEIDDFIIVGDDMGTVKKIGLKSTRIQTLQGEELIMSNQELTSARIHNYKKMKERRVQFSLGLEYGTSVAKLKKAKQLVKDTLKKIKDVRFDRVHFKSFGDFSLDYEIVYYIDTSDYALFMDKQEEINLKIKDAFEKAKIGMAFPTQTIIVKK